MNDIRIQIDFDIPSSLVDIYKISTNSSFIWHDKPLTFEQAEKKLHEYANTKCLSIMKIWKDNNIVGYSFPRKITDTERKGFKLLNDNSEWHRLGTVFILPIYRGLGIVQEVIRIFSCQYPNLVWMCEDNNIASAKSAVRSGFLYSHHIYFYNDSKWSFDSDDMFIYGYKVFKFIKH